VFRFQKSVLFVYRPKPMRSTGFFSEIFKLSTNPHNLNRNLDLNLLLFVTILAILRARSRTKHEFWGHFTQGCVAALLTLGFAPSTFQAE
jgi:hypothetical protein